MSVEEHEEIPWSMLVEQDRRGRSRTWYAAAAVVLAAVVGFAGIRWIDGRRHGEAPALVTADQPAPTTSITAPPTTTAMISEADLMAVDPIAANLAAVARAEWFVTDYFTVDGAQPPDLADAFATDAALPELPHTAGDAPVSFVEWARATSTRPHRTGLIVTVLFRTLFEIEDGSFERSDVRAVDVLVLFEDGVTAIGELPMPSALPAGHQLGGWFTGTTAAPADAVAHAIDRAALWGAGEVPELVESASDGATWRVVVAVEDPSGMHVPLAVRSDTI